METPKIVLIQATGLDGKMSPELRVIVDAAAEAAFYKGVEIGKTLVAQDYIDYEVAMQAEWLKCGRSKLNRLIDDGKIRVTHRGEPQMKVSVESIKAYRNSQSETGPRKKKIKKAA